LFSLFSLSGLELKNPVEVKIMKSSFETEGKIERGPRWAAQSAAGAGAHFAPCRMALAWESPSISSCRAVWRISKFFIT